MSDDLNVNDTVGPDATMGEPVAQSPGTAVADESETVGDAAAALISEAPVAASARLIVKRSGAESDDAFDVFPPAVVGRFDPSVGPVDIDMGPLPEGVYVSRKHAILRCEDGVWTVEDLGSSNGTFVLEEGDYRRIEGRAELSDGDEIAMGNAKFVFRTV